MIFKDNSEEVPLDTLIWCIPKYHRVPNEVPKLTTVFISPMAHGNQRRMTGGFPACDFMYGDPIHTPTVDII